MIYFLCLCAGSLLGVPHLRRLHETTEITAKNDGSRLLSYFRKKKTETKQKEDCMGMSYSKRDNTPTLLKMRLYSDFIIHIKKYWLIKITTCFGHIYY